MPTMPKSKVEELIVPGGDSADPIKVTIQSEPNAGMVLDVAEDGAGITNGARSSTLLSVLIQSWNLVDDEGNPLPITVDNIRALPTESFMFLSNHVAEKIKTAQPVSTEKKSSSTLSSQPPATANP